MPVSQHADNPDTRGHLVHLYGQDDSALIAAVTRYLARGLQRGDGLIVVATPEHAEAFAAGLRDESSYPRAVLEGRVLWMDARETLDRLMSNGEPNWNRFLVSVGDVVRDLQERGGGRAGVRAYGEMVGLLWSGGQIASAARLEDYWNRLIEVTGCDLFCSYPLDVFGEEFTSEALDVILSQHSHLVSLSEHLEAALSRSIEEVLGSRVEGLRLLQAPQLKQEWAAVPPAEGLALWVRRHFQHRADEIFSRARKYYLAAS